ncbi:isopentenyl diphosphate isomerase [Jaminaea rosea]|uniref:isopentenyl-diphosphate Delta-isomerase n=1 Tax=Jaminaea rosea TaxID=1569628 RepID=A0A316URU5_9BASI|nr:isopentenyl diphosphate isomerase [Jaminaea rosea]PWN27704.1 isopentenyl diphosphate isomerase [Jaminaea rosea]
MLNGTAAPNGNAPLPTGEASSSAAADASSLALAGHDEEQIRLMEEQCIVVSNDDQPLRAGSKKECHLMSNILPPHSLLHRAFSVFLFHPETGKLLLQKRAPEKITFPDMWTNTCCSHPLAVKGEMEVGEDYVGVRRAAQRKLDHELGIPAGDVPLEHFKYLTRIHYLAECKGGVWGEHEIDYILFITASPTLRPNENEVCDTKWVSPEELRVLMDELDPEAFTPWFKLIVKRFLFPWWKLLLENKKDGEGYNADSVAHLRDDEIHRMV